MSSINPPSLPNDSLPSLRLPYGTSTPLNHQQQDSSDEEFKIPPPKSRLKPGFQNLKKSFLEPQELFDTVITLKPLYCTISSGEKNNVFFTLKNDCNITNQQKKGKADYTDDCGAWDTSRKPQPLAEDVVILKRSYTTLKCDATYKRRISWFENLPIKYKEKSQIAVVEYLGCLPNSYSIHGNTWKTEAAYKKTTPAVKEAIENGLTHGAKPFNLYSDQLLNNSHQCPRNLKQVYNIKQKVQREARKEAGKEDGHRQNSADHIQAVMKMFGQNPYIQDIVHIPGKPPGFILYTEQQMKDVADFCTLSQGLQNVLGIDRTFNLGECYVTVTVYKHPKLLRTVSLESPIMLGPDRLDTLALLGAELAINDLIVGSDEEKALTKAIQRCFSDVSLILCTRHLEENAKRQLQNKVGASHKVKMDIIKDIFGKHGLVCAEDSFTFDDSSEAIIDKCEELVPQFLPYLCERLLPIIRTYVFQPRKKHKQVPQHWTNNNCKTMNFILKTAVNWKPEKLPDLVDKLHWIVKTQYADMCRALRGEGNFQLAPAFSKFKITISAWNNKTEDEKEAYFTKFLNAKIKDDKNYITSTDGQLSIPKPQRLAKKPGQKTRATRTRTTKTFFFFFLGVCWGRVGCVSQPLVPQRPPVCTANVSRSDVNTTTVPVSGPNQRSLYRLALCSLLDLDLD
ncbi:hypothetical protein E2C01_020570 [Portunus trituberculatus]|uniref:MULE transposase domain-containing protein n=1 Tax=Portunus trituberculatus TaxID=210409 RepID=A0A5B7E0H5_PORTR|nr:hypothetical protein [Portunus trituberculatus]